VGGLAVASDGAEGGLGLVLLGASQLGPEQPVGLGRAGAVQAVLLDGRAFALERHHGSGPLRGRGLGGADTLGQALEKADERTLARALRGGDDVLEVRHQSNTPDPGPQEEDAGGRPP
jgi:hypothetical protein